MLFVEWMDNVDNASLFTSFPQLKKYLLSKYNQYELKYGNASTKRQIDALLIEFYPTLINIEKAYVLRANNDLTLDTLGNKQKISGTDVSTITGVDSKNYAGYEVLGEFERNNENRTDNRTNEQTITNYNFLDILNTLESSGHKVAWSMFENRFLKLFILIFELNI